MLSTPVKAQPEQPLGTFIEALKKDTRGPYQAIKWFCPDGGILGAQERCASPGGIQHGLLKEAVKRLEKEKNIYLDLVLAGSVHDRIWDAPAQHSRIKQYAMIQYLFQADDGWIYRNARYYRGALQAEDESAWGAGFLKWLLTDHDAPVKTFFMVREACRVIPHPGLNKNRLQTIRTTSKTLSDLIPGFLPLRIKLHGQPDAGDVVKVKAFVEKNSPMLDDNQRTLFTSLIDNLGAVYGVSGLERLEKQMSGRLSQLPELSELIKSLGRSMDDIRHSDQAFSPSHPNPHAVIADLLLKIRTLIPVVDPGIRLPLMDFSLELEKVLFSSIARWQPRTLASLMEKCAVLARAAAGCGYMEMWEWSLAASQALGPSEESMPFKTFQLKVEQIRRMVDWGALMIRSTYGPELTRYAQFEPLAPGFVDDRIRSSVLLALGEAVGDLTKFAQTAAGVSHQLSTGIKPQGIRGLNPGLAHGILEVFTGLHGTLNVDSKKIYAFKTIPSELKPVAGMLTVSEGNLVSHVQLLARNLGIPNAVISADNLDSLADYAGQEMFYAVSQRGAVVLRPVKDLSNLEKDLIKEKKRTQDRFRVPVEKIDLTQKTLKPLDQVRALDSGRICGPKAANLGQLKFLFPDKVVNGIVIPFGIFRAHMDQTMPDQPMSYWQFLTKALSSSSMDDTQLIATLGRLQAAIETMPFLPGFETALAEMFEASLGKTLGSVPVFIRSDTNMEDIKGFTGAGLNLTLFNVRDRQRIFQGIRSVWASPYTERSYLWRQKYLENPENVFPSILLLPSVNVEKSGVVITHGIVSNDPEDITAAFSRGAGGAVDGQSAETWLMTDAVTDLLLYPARESRATRLPVSGGVDKEAVIFDQPVLTPEERRQIRELVKIVRNVLPHTPGIEGDGPFDIELGFINGAMRLFQVRPFVENKRAGTLNYLLNLDEAGVSSPAVLTAQTPLP